MRKINLDKFKRIERETKEINIDPLQTGGKIPEFTKPSLITWLDGYSICDFCPGSLFDLKTPPVKLFVEEILPEFLGCDQTRITHGAREGKYAIMHAVTKPGDWIVVDANAHYSSIVAAERAKLNIKKTEKPAEPEYKINPEDYKKALEEIEDGTGNPAALALLTYPDGSYGNLPDAKKISEICKSKGVPLILNGAYSVGRMPLNMKELGADFIVGSGHKSMAASGPVGVLGTTEEYAEKLFRRSEYYPAKEVEMLGCTVRGMPAVSLMLSFPFVQERVKHWEKEVENARWFSEQMEKQEIAVQYGEKPHNHDLMFFMSEKLYQISKKHKKRGFFLYQGLKKRGISGIKPGLTKQFKLSTYGLEKEDLEKVINALLEIIEENNHFLNDQ